MGIFIADLRLVDGFISNTPATRKIPQKYAAFSTFSVA
jgi:hypothetical protein